MTSKNLTSPSETQILQQNILNALSSAPGDFTTQCEQLKAFVNENKKEACRVILHNLIQLKFPQNSACEHWYAIVTHAKSLQSNLGRPVGLATAACDYFSSIQPSLENPKLIEFARFEETLKSAQQDFLTGLFSRGAFQNLFEQEISRAKRHKRHLALIFFDLDNFKNINDEYGHLAGDEALKQVGNIFSHSKRKEDIACRFGGDEFVILLPETNKYMGLLVGKKMHDRINKLSINIKGTDVPISCSAGLASFPLDNETSKGLMDCADRALYQAKSRGNHELSLFSEEKRTFTRIELKRDVKIRSLSIDENEDSSKCNNISEGGILITCNYSFDIGTRIELLIPLQDKASMTVIGSVVRVEKFDTNLYDIGLSFLSLNSSVKSTETIAEYVLQQLA